MPLKEAKWSEPNTAGAKATVTTTGVRFADGAAIEPTRRTSGQLELLYRSGEVTRVGQQIDCGDVVYKLAELDESFRNEVRFPRGLAPFGTASELASEIARTIGSYTGLSRPSLALLTAFAISTWCTTDVAVAPWLSINGRNSTLRHQLLRLLKCFSSARIIADALHSQRIFRAPSALGVHIDAFSGNTEPRHRLSYTECRSAAPWLRDPWRSLNSRLRTDRDVDCRSV